MPVRMDVCMYVHCISKLGCWFCSYQINILFRILIVLLDTAAPLFELLCVCIVQHSHIPHKTQTHYYRNRMVPARKCVRGRERRHTVKIPSAKHYFVIYKSMLVFTFDLLKSILKIICIIFKLSFPFRFFKRPQNNGCINYSATCQIYSNQLIFNPKHELMERASY